MKIGYFQFDPEFGAIATNLKRVTDRLASVDCDLLVLPEFAFTGYQFIAQDEVMALAEPVPEGITTQTFVTLAREQGRHFVVGLAERVDDRCYNSAILVGPGGFLGLYRKTHLFFEETLFFTPGDTGFQVWDIGWARVGLMVCFDWFYPEAARTLALKGADILCHPSNLVLPHCPDAMVTRCLENRVFGVTANRIGHESRGGKPVLKFIGKSEVVSPKGEILRRASTDEEEVGIVEVDVNDARQKSINPYNDLLRDRQPQHYSR